YYPQHIYDRVSYNCDITKVPPNVDVCEWRYVFNQIPVNGATFNPTGPCPPTTQPESLKVAYAAYQNKFESAFKAAVNGSTPPPHPSILGTKEANIVAEWSRRQARGERVPIEPPTLNPDGTISQSTRMGRIASPVGRKMAALDAEKAARKRAEEEKAASVAAAKHEKEQEKQRLAEATPAPATPPADAATATAMQAPLEGSPAGTAGDGMVSKVKKRLLGMFGG